ncbi:helicase [Penicillium sp. IBT 18751x]|nr:helicase [Penicillium sp. IBT 18751x]
MTEPLTGPFGGILADEMGLVKTLTMRIIPEVVVARKYHGQSRESQNENVQHVDVMLATYATAVSELRRCKSLLHRTDFYRLVLDEAHNIRRRKTRQYATVSEISATRRWCLIGTPIQNHVDDLGTLVSFLKVPLLDDPEVFRVHVRNQKHSNVSNRFDNLRKLLGCICLRMTKAIGYLDDPTVDLLYLDLGPAEAQIYNDIVRHHRARLEMAVSLEDNANASQQIFKAIHELRLFCNNGTREAKERSYIEFDTIKEDRDIKVCPQDDKAEPTSYGRKIHELGGTNRHNFFRFTEESSEIASASKIIMSNELDCEAIHSTMLSSKLCALLKRSVEQPPGEKCRMLQHHNIDYLRIDGSVSSAERQRALRGFDSVSERIVLLLTIGTGAVGLNLTSATRVHILEPQWNPMVEQQAIGRALRLG